MSRFLPAAVPANEDARLAALRRYEILDSAKEGAFDRLTSLASKIFDVPIALISLIDLHRQWFKSCVGLSGAETSRDVAFCSHAIHLDEPLVIPDALEDDRFAENPSVRGDPKVRFYAGAPLRTPEGWNVGTLCLIDTKPRTLTPMQIEILVELSKVVVDEMELRLVKRKLEGAVVAAENHQNELAVHTALMHNILDTAAEGIIVADKSGSFMIYNQAAERMTGLGPDRKVIVDEGEWGRFLPDTVTRFPLQDLPMARALRGEATENVEVFFKNRAKPDGVLLRATGRPLRTGEGVSGGVVTFTDITELRRIQNELAELATTDPLTGLPNKRVLQERLDLLVAEGGRGRKFAVMMTDVDHFKKVNDTYGHGVGDEVLVAVARALRGRARKTDLVARYGGEEFCVLLTDVSPDSVLKVAEDYRGAIAAIEKPVAVTSSFGICEYGGSATSASALMKAADEALYAAKRAGRNRVVRSEM